MLATIAKVVDGVAHAVRDVALGEKVLRQIVDEALGHIESGLDLLGGGRLARGPRIDRVHSRTLFGEALLVLGDGLLGMGGAIVMRGAHHFPSNGFELRQRILIQRQAVGAKREHAALGDEWAIPV